MVKDFRNSLYVIEEEESQENSAIGTNYKLLLGFGSDMAKNNIITHQQDTSFYKNPNDQNDMSMMNISHLSGAHMNTNNSPGMNFTDVEASKVFLFITNEDHNGLI